MAALVGLATAPSAIATARIGQQVVVGESQPSKHANRSRSRKPLIASAAACPGQNHLDIPAEQQVETMRCMTDFARRQAGLGSLGGPAPLDVSAGRKARDILSCDSFSHSACGREFTYWMKETGYLRGGCWRAGENLAWGIGQQGGVRAIFLAWMHSPEHRQNILGSYTDLGLGVEVGTLEGRDGTRVWTQHFGSHCDR